jgi:hypothetical protein
MKNQIIFKNIFFSCPNGIGIQKKNKNIKGKRQSKGAMLNLGENGVMSYKPIKFTYNL